MNFLSKVNEFSMIVTKKTTLTEQFLFLFQLKTIINKNWGYYKFRQN